MNHVDVVIIGGSNAGLSAALTLGRSCRKVAVIDAGDPRNAPASHAHNIFTRDGTPPSELLRIGREQLEPYDVEVLQARVSQITGSKNTFELTLDNGESLSARRIVLATGISDDLPDVLGIKELWGKSIFTCPYCHGWEVRGKPLVVVGDGAANHYGYARLIQHWSRNLIFIAGETPVVTLERLADLEERGIRVVEANVTEFEHDGGKLEAVQLSNGESLARHAAFMPMPMSLKGDLHTQLGCELSEDGDKLIVDDKNQTSVAGVYAAGDIVTTPMHSVTFAMASAQKTATSLNVDLIIAAS